MYPEVNIMLDLETMSTEPNAAIISIGAVEMDFKNGTLGRSFYGNVELSSSVNFGGHLCPNTVSWWLKQESEAVEALQENAVKISSALLNFTHWVEHLTLDKEFYIWANGANFDGPIMRSAYKRAKLYCPWKFYQERCYRTMKQMFPEISKPEFNGTPHNALDDAKFQAEHLLRIVRRKNSIGELRRQLRERGGLQG